MTKYHVNPETGRVGVCNAKKQCPLVQAIHGDTKEEARKAYETTMMAVQFPVLKKEKPFEPKIIGDLNEVSSQSGGKKNFFGEPGFSEILWFTHENEVIGYAKISRRAVWWAEEKQELPLDLQAESGEGTRFYTTLADFEVRTPGLGHGRKLLEKLRETYGDIYTTGGATPEGAKFLQANRDLFKQDPAYSSGRLGERVQLSSPNFESSYESMEFVADWDNARSKYPV